MGGRSFNITSGAIKDTLVGRCLIHTCRSAWLPSGPSDLQCVVCNVQCAVYSAQSAVGSGQYIEFSAVCSLQCIVPGTLAVAASVRPQEDQVVEVLELGETLHGEVGELVLPEVLGGVEAEQDGVEGVQVDHGAVRVSVVGGNTRKIFI